ncbi:hypothetical protein [Methylomonas sp. TEB]|uniref:hypothetical protein n=1 Tax=Methylomonas sp. TEB TaxID=3398229 RepID=UPI0039F472A8
MDGNAAISKQLATPASGCLPLPNQTTAQIANRTIDYALSRNGEKTAVFENGLGG